MRMYACVFFLALLCDNAGIDHWAIDVALSAITFVLYLIVILIVFLIGALN